MVGLRMVFEEARITELAFVFEVVFAYNIGDINVIQWTRVAEFAEAFRKHGAERYCWLGFGSKLRRDKLRGVGKVWRLCVERKVVSVRVLH